MQIVQETDGPEALVELEVVKVVELWGWQEREMIARVSNDCGHQGHAEPDPGGDEVAAQQERTQSWGQEVGEKVLHRVSVESCQANRGRPLVVDLVESGVEQGAVQQEVRVIEPNLLDQDKDWKLQQDPLDGWNLSGLVYRF